MRITKNVKAIQEWADQDPKYSWDGNNHFFFNAMDIEREVGIERSNARRLLLRMCEAGLMVNRASGYALPHRAPNGLDEVANPEAHAKRVQEVFFPAPKTEEELKAERIAKIKSDIEMAELVLVQLRNKLEEELNDLK